MEEASGADVFSGWITDRTNKNLDTGFLSSQIELALPKIDTGFLSSQIELALPKYDLKFTKPGIEELLPRFNFYASWMEDAFSSILRSATLAFWSQYKIFETGGHASDFEPLKGGGEVDPLLMELAFMLSEHLGKHGSPTKRQKTSGLQELLAWPLHPFLLSIILRH